MSHTFLSLLAFGLLAAPGSALAQQQGAPPVASADLPAAPVRECPTLTGVITDQNHQPLTGATIVVQGISDAYSTNSEGRYIIAPRRPMPQAVHLQISAVGYETQKLELTGCQPPEVMLRSLPGTRFKRDGRIKKTTSTGKIK
ncbi:carboxypeptidase-like regulatory domain-containing protein [Hymenobacter algoricola]|uniref:Carboxypeptidase-like regulatory domain-containing protein n=1 Tax=Hymenobacter algoricola TaxID=486267 RepID=A0ABP7N6N4_9BACT